MEGNIAKTYTLIYSFLKKRSHPKAAEAVKRAAKGVVVLRDDIEHRGPELDEIVNEWRTRQIKKVSFAVTDSSSDSEESSDDSDSSSGSDSSSSSNSAPEPKSKSKPGVVFKGTSGSSEDDDSSDTSSEEEVLKSKPSKQTADGIISSTRNAKPKGSARQQSVSQKEPNPKSLASNSSRTASLDSDADSGSDSDSDSDSSDSSSDEGTISKDVTKQTLPQAPVDSTCSSSSSESSSSSSESSSESDGDTSKDNHKTKQPCANTPKIVQKPPQKDEDAQATKKRKTSGSGAAVVTAVTTENNGRLLHQKGGKPPRKANERFQRVKPQTVVPELIMDNGYEAKTRVQNDYGERAHRDLIVTRGAGFRKEKNKKKRGSYRGGEITLENHSIKFDY